MIKKLLLLASLSFSVNVFATPVNINKADAKTIADSLNGIGLKKAEAIVSYRVKNGDFKDVNELTNISGIGVKTIEKNKADILLTDTVEPSVPADTTQQKSTPVDTQQTDAASKKSK